MDFNQQVYSAVSRIYGVYVDWEYSQEKKLNDLQWLTFVWLGEYNMQYGCKYQGSDEHS